jgi:hypothetical protein
MNMNLTPEKAWEHVKALWPDAECIRKRMGDTIVNCVVYILEYQIPLQLVMVDWPDGFNRYPPKEEWRDAVWPQDWGKEARFRDGESYSWQNGVLCGMIPKRHFKWFAADKGMFVHCQVRVTEQDKEPPDADRLEPSQPERDFLTKEQIAEFLLSDEFMRKLVDTALATPFNSFVKDDSDETPPSDHTAGLRFHVDRVDTR